MELEIRLIRPEEYTFANDLYNTVYGSKREFSRFEWEFLHAPFGKAIYVVAIDKNKSGNPVIGTQSAIPIILLNSKGDEILTAKSEDTLLDPSYRGKKIFEKM